jgi:5-(carboxyamino)imidazole ribonucleotide synthase
MISKKEITGIKTGILGGGQLGKMLSLAAGNWHLPVYFLDESPDYPAGMHAPEFFTGNFNDYEDVYEFGRKVDVLSIEIEHVNSEALHQLWREGLVIHPTPDKLDLIKDKGLQKAFYREHGIPTAPFQFFDSGQELANALARYEVQYPIVQKSRTAGYDGRGVAVMRSPEDLHKLLPGPCIAEVMADIDKELAVIVARNERGETAAFPAVEMDFNPDANLVEFLLCPARVPLETARAAEALAVRVMQNFDLCGLLAVELFLLKNGELWVNEVAPRPHNSGHHTIDSCRTSQFEQHLRAILDLPLGDPALHTPAVMVNLLGEPGFAGPVQYEGLEAVMAIPGVRVHLYGKTETRPFRKMGHITIVDAVLENAIEKARMVQQLFKVKSR